VLAENEWKPFAGNMRQMFPEAFKDQPAATEVFSGDGPASGAYLGVRGVGPDAFNVDEKKLTQIRRRYWLIGQTLEGMRVFDVKRAITALKSIDSTKEIRLSGFGEMGTIALYAAIFEPVAEVELRQAPASHFAGPQLLNVMKLMDVPQAAAIVCEKSKVRIVSSDSEAWKYPKDVARKLGWKTFQLTSDN
jgi:hypothetical protein